MGLSPSARQYSCKNVETWKLKFFIIEKWNSLMFRISPWIISSKDFSMSLEQRLSDTANNPWISYHVYRVLLVSKKGYNPTRDQNLNQPQHLI